MCRLSDADFASTLDDLHYAIDTRWEPDGSVHVSDVAGTFPLTINIYFGVTHTGGREVKVVQIPTDHLEFDPRAR